jgi:EmrB/QacA subfamily drug resistance transporter
VPIVERQTAGSRTNIRRWYVLAVVSIAQLMSMLDVSVVNVALPSAQADLGFGNDARQWVITAYALAFGSLLLLGGRVGDLFGRRRVFLTSLVAFALASALCGAAPSFAVLVVARALQGAAAAMLAPAALGILITTYTGQGDRGKAFGVFAAVTMGGGGVGLVLGGILTEYLSWRWCMYVNVVFAASAFSGGLAYVPRVRAVMQAKLDLIGAALASLGLFALVFGLSRAAASGWSSAVTIASLAIGAVLLLSFVLAERTIAQPLLPLRIVADRARATAFTTAAIGGIAMFGLFLFLTYYLQLIKGFSPLQSGLAFLPLIICIAVSSNVTNIVLLRRFGPRVVIACGMALAFLGLAYLSRLHVHSSYAANVLPTLIVVGLAQGAVMAPSMNTATAGVQPQDAGAAAALVNTMTQVGGSIGTAIMSTIAATVTSSYVSSHPHALGFERVAATHGYTVVFAVAALVFAAGGILAVAFFPSKARLEVLRGSIARPDQA